MSAVLSRGRRKLRHCEDKLISVPCWWEGVQDSVNVLNGGDKYHRDTAYSILLCPSASTSLSYKAWKYHSWLFISNLWPFGSSLFILCWSGTSTNACAVCRASQRVVLYCALCEAFLTPQWAAQTTSYFHSFVSYLPLFGAWVTVAEGSTSLSRHPSSATFSRPTWGDKLFCPPKCCTFSKISNPSSMFWVWFGVSLQQWGAIGRHP